YQVPVFQPAAAIALLYALATLRLVPVAIARIITSYAIQAEPDLHCKMDETFELGLHQTASLHLSHLKCHLCIQLSAELQAIQTWTIGYSLLTQVILRSFFGR